MSTTEIETPRRGGWQTFAREVPFDVSEGGDGRTLVSRIVPYGVVANVADPPDFRPYRETFDPGAFRAQLGAANRIGVVHESGVLLNFEHGRGIGEVVGRGVALDDREDGLHGSFRIVDHPDGDKALELIHAGVLRGMSAEFAAKRSRSIDGVVHRIDARVVGVALCRTADSAYAGPKAAYQGAEILAVRHTDIEETFDPRPPNFERLEALGILPVFDRAVVRRPWSGDPSRFTDEQYARSCLIDRGGDAPPKERCSLPVLEPNGDLNANALGAAFAALRGARSPLAGVTSAQKAAAARKLVRYYRQAQMTPPAGLLAMAG